jgi:hypothetical protein
MCRRGGCQIGPLLLVGGMGDPVLDGDGVGEAESESPPCVRPTPRPTPSPIAMARRTPQRIIQKRLECCRNSCDSGLDMVTLEYGCPGRSCGCDIQDGDIFSKNSPRCA